MMFSVQNQSRHRKADAVKANDKARRVLLGVISFCCGTLGLILFRWTPTSGLGILVFVALLVAFIGMVIALSARKRAG